MARRSARFGSWTSEEQLRRLGSELFFPSNDSAIDDDAISVVDVPPRPNNSTGRKRKATSTLPRVPTPILSSPPIERADEPKMKIKTEGEIKAIRALEQRNPEERVKIFVGKTNQEFNVAVETLDKSPILKSLLCRNAGEEPYIMHPLLTIVDTKYFQSVYLFLATDEYVPAIVSNPLGQDVFPKQLDGLTTVEDYRKEVIRAGHVYIIAKQLRMTSLENLVFRKITDAQYHPYGPKSLLDLSMIVFSRNDQVSKGNFKKTEATDEEDSDKLEDWLIENLIDKLQAVLLNHAQLFFQVVNNGACKKRGFGVRIFRGKVEEWERFGPDTVAIEDDE